MPQRHALTDEQWLLIEPLFRKTKAKTGRPPRDPRQMLDGVLWILNTGAAWRDLPARFGPWQTVFDHFSNWRRNGVFTRVVEALQIKLDQKGLIDWELWCVDGSNVRASRAAAGAETKVSSATPTSPRTTVWAAAKAGSEPSSTWLLTATELRSRSR
jgi:transposase